MTAPRTAAPPSDAAQIALVKAIRTCIVDASSMNVVMHGPEVNAAIREFRAAIEAEAIEPLLALVRAAQAAFVAAEFPHGADMSTWSKAEVERFWVDADTRWMEARRTFLTLYVALPESVRVAARKPE